MSDKSAAKYVVATDVGGTCTDTIVFAEGEPLYLGKALSTPPNFAEGVLNSIANAASAMGTTNEALFAETSMFVHGSTVVDNALFTRDGAKTGLITTEGFEDTLPSTRGAYGRWAGLTEDRIKHPVKTDRAAPLVDADCIRGVHERIDYKGAVLAPLDEEATEAALRSLLETKSVAAIAVCFLWSFYNAAHEQRVAQILKKISPDTYISLSSEIAPVPGEYERTSTTVINAYAGRITSDYLTNLQSLLTASSYDGPILVMQGYGGLLPAADAGDRPVGMIECGPAAGVIGSRYLGEIMGDGDVIAADMGGTTFKVGVIQNGELEYAREPMVNRYHYLAPKIEVVSIGAGGGSIVALEEGTNIPQVGPRSAGARPGPVCYGQGGTEPTLTDVMTLIGYMDPGTFLGGSIELDIDGARRVFEEKIAKPMGMDTDEAAFGIYRIAAAQISDLIHEITVERGLDPRDFVLHAFGGSCPLLCGVFGEELNVQRIVIPYTASVNASFGLVSADIVHEYSVTKTLDAPAPADEINQLYAPLLETAKAQLTDDGFADSDIQLDYAVDLRYARQVHEVTTPMPQRGVLADSDIGVLVDDFEALYERKYGKGSAYRDAGMEMTMFRLTARGLMTRPEIEKVAAGAADPAAAHIGQRNIFVEAKGGFATGDIFDFDKLAPGNIIAGPTVIHTPMTTMVVQQNQTGRMDEYRNMIIEFTG